MSHFGSHRRTGMLACAGPSRPHTCVSGSPGRGGWGGQRSPLWATATGPGLFRSLGFKNPSGYWLFGGQHTAIQRVGRLGGAEAPACVVCVFACAVVPCAKFQNFSEGGRSSGSAPGVCREGGGSSPGIGGLPPIPSVGAGLSGGGGWSPPPQWCRVVKRSPGVGRCRLVTARTFTKTRGPGAIPQDIVTNWSCEAGRRAWARPDREIP